MVNSALANRLVPPQIKMFETVIWLTSRQNNYCKFSKIFMLFVHLLFISSVNKYTIISALQNCRFVQI